MSETKTPETKSFVEQLDDSVQKIKCNPKIMLEYITLQLPEEEISQMWADGSMIRIIANGTHRTKEEVSKILADDMPKNLEV